MLCGCFIGIHWIGSSLLCCYWLCYCGKRFSRRSITDLRLRLQDRFRDPKPIGDIYQQTEITDLEANSGEFPWQLDSRENSLRTYDDRQGWSLLCYMKCCPYGTYLGCVRYFFQLLHSGLSSCNTFSPTSKMSTFRIYLPLSPNSCIIPFIHKAATPFVSFGQIIIPFRQPAHHHSIFG